MKTLFISAGPIEWGSSRMRCWWVAEEMEDAKVAVWNYPNDLSVPMDFDVYIIQKNGQPSVQKQLIDAGKTVYLDHCDPMWWFSNQEYMRQIFDNAHGAVFSTQALERDFLDWYGEDYKTVHIPDRLKLSHFPKKRMHIDTSPVRFVWFGLHVNRIALAGAWANLHRLHANGHNISLTIVDDRPDIPLQFGDEIPILYAKWSLEHENAQLAAHDVALLPPYPGPWGKVKSNNKAMTAHACGLPPTDGHDYADLIRLMDRHERKIAHKERTIIYGNVKQSAKEWERFIND